MANQIINWIRDPGKATALKLIQRIKNLCDEFKYDEAIALTNEIPNKLIATKAHLLCMEHEEAMRKAGKLPTKEAAANAT